MSDETRIQHIHQCLNHLADDYSAIAQLYAEEYPGFLARKTMLFFLSAFFLVAAWILLVVASSLLALDWMELYEVLGLWMIFHGLVGTLIFLVSFPKAVSTHLEELTLNERRAPDIEVERSDVVSRFELGRMVP